MARLIPVDEVPDYLADVVWMELESRTIDLVRITDIITHNGKPCGIGYRSFWVQGERMLDSYGSEWRLWEANVETVGVNERWDLPWN